jgi:hypothetical protein
MDSHKIHVVFPKDETTDFLQNIIDHVIDNTEADVYVHRLETPDDHRDFFATAQTAIPVSATVLYMGHGMSSALSGASTPEHSYGAYIKEGQLSLFKQRKTILLTCRSNEYLANYFGETNLKAAIGFPNLITDEYELYYPEESERVSGVTSTEIKAFRQHLLNIMKYSLEDFINSNLSFYQLYTRIKIRNQRSLINFYTDNPNKGILPFGKMLYDLDKGISFLGN